MSVFWSRNRCGKVMVTPPVSKIPYQQWKMAKNPVDGIKRKERIRHGGKQPSFLMKARTGVPRCNAHSRALPTGVY